MTVPIVQNDTEKAGQFASVFQWYAETQGYEWGQGILVARRNAQPQGRFYRPAKTLYRTFASLKPTKREIQRFADKFGPICLAEGVRTLKKSGQFGSGDQFQGLTLSQWNTEIRDLREFVSLWDAIRNRDVRTLKRVIVKHSSGAVSYQNDVRYRLLATPALSMNVKLLERFDTVKSALYALRQEINTRLSKLGVAPRLVWCPGPRKENNEVTQDHHLRVVFYPSDLLGAMWLQFARDVAGNHVLSACSECGGLLQTGPGGWKYGTKTCSPRCRKRLSRRLKKSLH